VTVHGQVGGLSPPVNAYFAQLLRQLGYTVTLHEMPDTQSSGDFLYNPRNHLQIMPGGWIADFPLASNFYHALVACGTGSNLSEYCNPELDQRAAAAIALEATDPAAALQAWTQIDRTLTDEAVIVPTVNQIDSWFVSTRVGNFQSNSAQGPLLSQIWVR
jgi:ABC-type oligopeptide transport system substrate-binding subunit